jgi:hypothetical protein
MGKGRLDAAFLLLRELSEPNADPVRFAPDHLAAMRGAVRQKDQREAIGDAERAGDVQSCAGLGPIANNAVDCTAAELDRSSLQKAMT